MTRGQHHFRAELKNALQGNEDEQCEELSEKFVAVSCLDLNSHFECCVM